MRALKLKNNNDFKRLIFKRGNDHYHPVHDVNGDLFLDESILTNPKFADLADEISSLTEVAEVVTERVDGKSLVDELRREGKLRTIQRGSRDTEKIVRNGRNR